MMASYGFFMLLSMLLNGSGGGSNELLDYIPTEAYWQQKNVPVTVQAMSAELTAASMADLSALIPDLASPDAQVREATAKKIRLMGPAAIPALKKETESPDAETAHRAKSLITEINADQRPSRVRRLLAIRALGELKKKEALAVLQPLLESKEPFVAEYAASAIAQIDDRPLPVIKRADLEEDVWLMPANVGVVAQVRMQDGPPVSFEKALEKMPMPEGTDKKKMIDDFTKRIVEFAEKVGNMRIDGVTVGVSDDVGDNSGFVTIIAQGQYDHDAVKSLIKQAMQRPPGQQRFPEGVGSEDVDGMEILHPDHEVGIMMPSDQQFIFLAGANHGKAIPSAQIVQALKQGKGLLDTSEPMVKLLKSVDRTQPLWAVANISPAYRQAPIIKAFDTITLVGKQKDDQLDFTVSGAGSDAAAIKAAVEEFNDDIQKGIAGMQRMQQHMPAMNPMLDFMKSMKATANEKNATLTATLKGSINSLLLVFGGMRM